MSAIYSRQLNHGKFETWTTRPNFDFYEVKQVHGTDIVSPFTLPCEADGIFTSWQEFQKSLAIKTADCLPIVIEGDKGIVFLHAGWRGLADGILKSPEVTFINPNRAFIGPSIHKCCFEVSKDFKNNFPDSPHFMDTEGKYYFDLQLEAQDQLLKIYPALTIEDSAKCTCCDHTFHSYRRDKTIQRNWNIYLKG